LSRFNKTENGLCWKWANKILEECSTRKYINRKVNDTNYLASAPRKGYSGIFSVYSVQVHPLRRLLVGCA
jgi:hypothetical protein